MVKKIKIEKIDRRKMSKKFIEYALFPHFWEILLVYLIMDIHQIGIM